MADKDFWYNMPDGSAVEAFQVTDASLFQDDESPDWFHSKMLFTKSAADTAKAGSVKHWLKIDENETPIPKYGWILRRSSGVIEVVDYTVMENAVKVVREVPKIPDIAKPMPDKALRLAAKMSKKTFEEVKIEDAEQVEEANANRQAIIDSLHPDDAADLGLKQTEPYSDIDIEFVDAPEEVKQPEPESIRMDLGEGDHGTIMVVDYQGLLVEVREAYQLLSQPKVSVDDGIAKIREALSKRTNWCACAPGQCNESEDSWQCRQKSPLVR